jgi:tRNA(adenine34) deaminase
MSDFKNPAVPDPQNLRPPELQNLHAAFMREAIAEASLAAAVGEVPVGAVVVLDGKIVGRGHNQPIATNDPTAHAEIVALREAARAVSNYRLTDTTLYVTVEPCLMCIGACVHARIGTLVYGTTEPRAGAVESRQRAYEHPSLNHKFRIVAGVLAADCRRQMTQFFQERRR